MGILPIGEYTTVVIAPDNYRLTTTNSTVFIITANTSQHIDDDGLYHKPGTFTATVWYDDDNSQVKNNNEQRVNGTQVTVYDSANTLVSTYTTDNN